MSENFPTKNPNWELDSIFSGGVNSASFTKAIEVESKRLERLRSDLEELEISSKLRADEGLLDRWAAFLEVYFNVGARVGEMRSFSQGVAATNTDSAEAVRMPSRLDGVFTALDALDVELTSKFRSLQDEDFNRLCEDERFSGMGLWLEERRRDAEQAMAPELEGLAVELNRDGLHAWGRLYAQTTARMKVEVTIDGESKTMSVGQAKNLLRGSRKRAVRRATFEGLNEAWSEVAPVCAAALNGKVGAEQTIYRRRGGNCLTMPLQYNRVSRGTVDAIMAAAAEFRPLLVRYLKSKARLLGLEELEWYDAFAPVGEEEGEEKISYEQAQRFIVEQVESFSPKIAEFCRMALANQWVEVEDRAGKGQGGYCTSLPLTKQIRIFMTYGGTSSGVTTLAHELGHGYHFWVMRDLRLSEMEIPMGLAESASTLLEALVEQAALKQAEGSRRLSLLDERLGRAVAFLMDIPARFNVEMAMHKERASGILHEEYLTEITRDAFTKSYGGGVASVDSLIWASKLHFYITRMPFYNFPYTFGYLFSRALYDRAIHDEGFAGGLDDLLRNTGRMSCEELGERFLGVDLGQVEFWKGAAGSLAEDVVKFEEMVDAVTE